MSSDNIVLYIIASVVMMVLIAAGVILFFYFSQKKIQTEQLEKQAMKTKFQQDLLKKTVSTQEEERSRIARELHDDIGSKLNVIHLNLHLIRAEGKKGNNIDELIADIQSSLQNSITASRNISHGLMPPTLEKFGIQVAIEDLQRNINKAGQLEMKVNDLESCQLATTDSQLHLFRIIQELTQNALKHAKADTLYFTFSQIPGFLHLLYEDDGIGFPKDIDLTSGLGLSNLQTRMQLLGGEWLLDRNHRPGTKITFQIPTWEITTSY